jgi:microcystin-dependent protein
MKSRSHRITRSLTLAAVTAAACSWSPASYACTPEPYISAVCVMAMARNDLRNYAPAAGQIMSIAQNSALFALLGTTYGGNGQTTFGLPDLRGRVIVGAGTGTDGITYVVGQAAGSANVTLTTAQMPQHVHPVPPISLTGATATLDLSTVTGATANLSAATFNADISKLVMRANSGAGGATTPGGAALANVNGPAARTYLASAPNVDMLAGTVGGSITVSASGTAPVTLPGSASATLGGTLPASTTGVTGSSQPFSNMQPYLAMNYFIALQGVFPSFN